MKTRVQGSDGGPAVPVPRPLSNSSTPLLGSDRLMALVHPNPYRTTLSTVIYSYRHEGIGVFFRGLAPTLVR